MYLSRNPFTALNSHERHHVIHAGVDGVAAVVNGGAPPTRLALIEAVMDGDGGCTQGKNEASIEGKKGKGVPSSARTLGERPSRETV